MECPYLSGRYMKFCVAEKHDYVPSVYELREFCGERVHRVCRYYMRNVPGKDKERAGAGREIAVLR